MLATVVRKELWEDLVSQRFAISLLLATSICWTSIFVLTQSFNRERAEYNRRVNLKSQMLDNYFHSQAAGGMIVRPIKPPPTLSSIVRGSTGDWFVLGSIDENPVPALFPFMDLLFVIGLIMSVTALALSYDRISGEKESGMLKMLVLEGHARGKLLMGKWMGGVLSVLVILAIAFSGSVLIAHTLSESVWTAKEWTTLGMLFSISAFYCAAFFSLGLYVSTKSESPAVSVVLALLLWILFTLILPTVPPYIAKALYPTPSASRVQYELLFKLEHERKVSIRELTATYEAKGITSNKWPESVRAGVDSIRAEYRRKKRDTEKIVEENYAVRELITALLHFLSPFSSYVLAGAELSGTGALNQLHFLIRANEYENTFFREYLPRKEEEAKRRYPNYTGKAKLDISDRPRFEYVEEDLTARVAAAATHTVFILIYTALFFAMAWKSFLLYDVR